MLLSQLCIQYCIFLDRSLILLCKTHRSFVARTMSRSFRRTLDFPMVAQELFLDQVSRFVSGVLLIRASRRTASNIHLSTGCPRRLYPRLRPRVLDPRQRSRYRHPLTTHISMAVWLLLQARQLPQLYDSYRNRVCNLLSNE